MNDEITEPTVHLCWNDFAVRGAVHALRMANLDTMADDMEAQLKPAIEEPTEFGSMVRAGATNWTTRPLLWQKTPAAGKHYWESETGVVEVWSELTHVEVLRVGIGEPPMAPAQQNAQVWQSLTGRIIRFCTLSQNCRMADGHVGQCRP